MAKADASVSAISHRKASEQYRTKGALATRAQQGGPMNPLLYTPAQLARLCDISEAQIGLYEEEGLLSPVHIGDRSLYTDRERTRIDLIVKGRNLGFSLEEVGVLIVASVPKARPEQAGLYAARGEKRIRQSDAGRRALKAARHRLMTYLGKRSQP